MPPRSTHLPEDLFVGGIAYFRAAKLVALQIQDSQPEDYVEPLKLPAWHLTGMSIELLLKAVFIELGGSQDRLWGRDGIGHDLRKALDFAETQGFTPPSKFTGVLVNKLRGHHLNHTMRYLPSDMESIEVPRLGDALHVVERLADAVRPLIYPEHSGELG